MHTVRMVRKSTPRSILSVCTSTAPMSTPSRENIAPYNCGWFQGRWLLVYEKIHDPNARIIIFEHMLCFLDTYFDLARDQTQDLRKWADWRRSTSCVTDPSKTTQATPKSWIETDAFRQSKGLFSSRSKSSLLLRLLSQCYHIAT